MRRSLLLSASLVLGIGAVVLLALVHTDEIRGRAEAALGRGMPVREAELARGFVLGQDDRIDPATVEEFRRSGLSHLLAVSGQNVALLALLAMPVLGAFGLPLRARLLWVLGLIAVYVPLTGAGPSIQRAGIMGALNVLAALAGRRSFRLHALAVAAIVTLAVDPRIGADIGWQLSFAALLGILLLAAPLREWINSRLGGGGLRRALSEGAAMTISATLATAPLIAFHFGTVSTTTLVANLLALPAVAPAMWLGMLAAAGGQLPGFPVEAFNAINAPLLAYVAEVARWCAGPEWAYLQVRIGGRELLLSYLALLAIALLAPWLCRRRRPAGRRNGGFECKGRPARGRLWLVPPAALLLAAGFGWSALGPSDGAAPDLTGLRVTILDVGQGDSILLQPAGGEAVLVDTGPEGAGVAGKLSAAGVDRLGAALITHDQADHAGGLEELLAAVPVQSLLHGRAGRQTLTTARSGGTVPRRIAAGTVLRSARMRLEVLWPPAELLAGSQASEDPNRLSLVLLLRWHDFSMLLTGDAEAEAAPLDPGPVDALKVAHHGSDDAGLSRLLEGSGPSLAVVSVGEGNPFGHPTAATLATLAAGGVRTFRTDRDGTVVLEVRRGAIQAGTSG